MADFTAPEVASTIGFEFEKKLGRYAAEEA
jgi:hypothetical protein